MRLPEGDDHIELIYLSWQTHIFGFIDDMFIATEVDPDNSQNRIVNIQSQIRVGRSDMSYNDYYVKTLVTCLEAKLGDDASEKSPCSL